MVMQKCPAVLLAVGALGLVLAQSNDYKIIVSGEMKKELRFVTPIMQNSPLIKRNMHAQCEPTKMCIRISTAWLTIGFPMSLFSDVRLPLTNDLNPPSFYQLISRGEQVVLLASQTQNRFQTGLISLSFAQMLVELAEDKYQVLFKCAIGFQDQGLITVDNTDATGNVISTEMWEGCLPLSTLVNNMLNSQCLTSSLLQNGDEINFQTSLVSTMHDVGQPREGEKASFRFPIQCTYDLNYLTQQDFTPKLDFPVIKITVINPSSMRGVGKFAVYMTLSIDEEYTEFYTEAPILKETNRLYVETGILKPIDGALMTTKECWATPTEDSQNDKVILIENFCPTTVAQDPTGINLNGIDNNGQDTKNRWDSRVFQITPSERVFLFCRVVICFNIDGGNCEQFAGQNKCNNLNNGKRRRRSVDNVYAVEGRNDSLVGHSNPYITEEVISIGPVMPSEWVKNGHEVAIITRDGLESIIQEIAEDVVELERGSIDGFPQWLYILLGAGCIVIALLLILFLYNFVASKRYAV